jgi:hypothetical protein
MGCERDAVFHDVRARPREGDITAVSMSMASMVTSPNGSSVTSLGVIVTLS